MDLTNEPRHKTSIDPALTRSLEEIAPEGALVMLVPVHVTPRKTGRISVYHPVRFYTRSIGTPFLIGLLYDLRMLAHKLHELDLGLLVISQR